VGSDEYVRSNQREAHAVFKCKPSHPDAGLRNIGPIHRHDIALDLLEAEAHLEQWIRVFGHTQLPIDPIFYL